MNLNEETIYLHGNLCREWTKKTIESTGKQVIENALAWQPTKDSETTFVDITVWEERDGSTDHFDVIMQESNKGSRVMVHGRFKSNDYQTKDGVWKKGWNCSVWNIAKVMRAVWEYQEPSNFQPGIGRIGPADDAYKAAFKKNTGFDYDDNEPPFQCGKISTRRKLDNATVPFTLCDANATGMQVHESCKRGVVALTVERSYMNEKNEIMVSVRLPKTLVERIDETAIEEGRSRSGMIRRILDKYPASFVGGVRE